MKKTTVYILVLVLSLSLLCGCGDRTNNAPAGTPAPANDGMTGNGTVNDNDGIITDDDNGIMGGHNDANGTDNRNDNNGGAVGDVIDGNAPEMPEPNVGNGNDANGGAGNASGNAAGGGTSSRRTRLR